MMTRKETVYKIWMDLGIDGMYVYGTYTDANKANEIAMELREHRGCQTFVEQIGE